MYRLFPPQNRVADIELPCSASWECIRPHITSPGKGPNSKLKVWFLLNVYHFHTIIKSKHPRLGHICIFFMARFPGYFLWWPALWFWLLVEQTWTLSSKLWYLRVKGVLITDNYAALQTYLGSVLRKTGCMVTLRLHTLTLLSLGPTCWICDWNFCG